LGAVLLLLLISFSINIYSIKFDPIATFYSPLSRFWELLVGAFWACISLRKSQELKQLSQAVLNVFSWVGLLIRRRFKAGLENLSKYQNAVNSWILLDGDLAELEKIAQG
jgi:peptidoglycan/LPS O-acetylase OafA/YrhL